MRNMLHRSSSFENFNSCHSQAIADFDKRMNDHDSLMKGTKLLRFSNEKWIF